VGAVQALYEETVIDNLKLGRLGGMKKRSKFVVNSQFEDPTGGVGRGNIRTHCLEGDDSALASLFPLVAR
jgi:hypothetical protein